jgi:hypothetical protein
MPPKASESPEAGAKDVDDKVKSTSKDVKETPKNAGAEEEDDDDDEEDDDDDEEDDDDFVCAGLDAFIFLL